MNGAAARTRYRVPLAGSRDVFDVFRHGDPRVRTSTGSLRTGNTLLPFVVSLSNHEQKQQNQRLLDRVLKNTLLMLDTHHALNLRAEF